MSSSISPQKFLFDTRFEPASGVHCIDDEFPRFSALELQKAREEAFLDGQETGYQKAIQSIEHDISIKLEVLNALMTDAAERYETMGRAMFGEILNAALAMTRKILPLSYERVAKDEVTTLVEECLKSLLTQSKIIIRVHETLVIPVRERVAHMQETSGFDGQVVVLGDPEFYEIDCAVEWAEGGMYKVTQTILDHVDEILKRHAIVPDHLTQEMSHV